MLTTSIRRTIFFQIFWWVPAANLYMVCRVIGLDEMKRIELIEPIRYPLAFGQATSAGLIIGLLLGLIDVFLSKQKFRNRSFGSLVLLKGIIYITSIIVVILSILIITDLFIDHMGIKGTLQDVGQFIQQQFLLSMLVYALAISFLVSFVKQVNQKFGPGVLMPMFFGKYFKPQQEHRIFLFLDLRDSTTHAEKIGHIRYSEMIQDCFYDLATQIEKHRAEIYQYVGDEVILTWKTKTGLQNQNCLNAFFSFEEYLKSRSEYYRDKYGIQPEFKAGMNCGEVMVAEVGEIKKEIAYHGDVLNTAARIQSKCNAYGKNILISENLKNLFADSNAFSFTELGSTELKGKQAPVMVYSVEKK